MDYTEMKEKIGEMMNNNMEDFVKALVSEEKGINDMEALDIIYDAYMENDAMGLLDEQFDYLIDDLREQGLIQDEKAPEAQVDGEKTLENLKEEIAELQKRINERESGGKVQDFQPQEQRPQQAYTRPNEQSFGSQNFRREQANYVREQGAEKQDYKRQQSFGAGERSAGAQKFTQNFRREQAGSAQRQNRAAQYEDKGDTVNLFGNVVGKIKTVMRQNSQNGELFNVTNF